MSDLQEHKELENLTSLKNGDELVDVIEARYYHQRIYTLNGNTLIALNPNKNFEIYDVPTIEQYHKNGPFSDKAHIFSIANEALKNVRNGSEVENIVFGGSSSSGKTTNAFHVMRFLTTVAKHQSITCERINALQTVFESLGVAKTIKNAKSTRLGYAVEFMYKKGELAGLNVNGVLPLEVGKLTNHRAGESSFPILYELCYGLDAKRKEKLGLKEMQKYFYLNQVENRTPPTVYAETFSRFESALKTIGFSENQFDILYRLLAVVLHVGNIYFKTKKIDGGKQSVEIANESELKWIAHLLEIDWESLKTVFLSVQINKNDDLDDAPSQPAVETSIDKVLDIRDSFAKTIYHELFKWVLERISSFFECTDSDAKITVYDWFGFERYTNNSFEEFCINAVNEKVENFYINKVFKNFQNDYEDEGVSCDYKLLKSLDNDRTVKMLFARPCGLIPLLIDESRFPKGSDEAYLQRANLNHLDKSIYVKPRSKDRYEFGIRHSAGLAYYYVSGFLQKNRWTDLGTIQSLLNTSDDPSLTSLFSSSAGKNNRIVYTADEYAKAINELVKKLDRESCHFVRCVRVNSDRTSQKFDAELVGRQLKSLAVQETYHMSCVGYPLKYSFEKFINAYRCLLPIEVVDHNEPQQIVLDILHGQGSKFISDFAVGSHSVFMRDRLVKQLDSSKAGLQDTSAVVIQRNYRKHVARNQFLNQKAAAIRIQSVARGWSTRKQYQKLKKESLKKVEEAVTALPSAVKQPSSLPNTNDDDQIAPQNTLHFYEIPEDLNTIGDFNVPTIGKVRTQTTYLPFDVSVDSPSVDQFSIEEFAELNLKHHILQARREPIFTPFLPKSNEDDFHLSLKIFKLILRYMNDNTITETQRCIIAKFIIQQGIENLDQRDEIYMQLCNQTYNNKNPDNAKGAWNLLLMSVNSFPPGYLVFPMLKDYFEQQNEPLATMLLEGLFRLLRHTKGSDQMNRNRVFAPTVLEQQSYLRRQPVVVSIGLPDGDGIDVELDAWTMVDEIVGRILRLRGIAETEGWSLQIEDDKANITTHGPSFLFDALSPFEVPQVPQEYNPFVSFETFHSAEPATKESLSPTSNNRNIPEINGHRTIDSAMDSSTLKRINGILKSQSQTRMTPEEYAKMSVASRINHVRIPTNNGDVNKFLDEIFDQALPQNDETTRDTIAATIKGGITQDNYYSYPTRNGYPSPYYAPSRYNDARETPSSINLSVDDGRSSNNTMSRADDIPSRNRNIQSPSSPPMDGRVSRTYMNDDSRPLRNHYEPDDVRSPITMQIRSNERAMTPSGASESSRIGQMQPTSQRARYIGANGLPNSRQGTLNTRRRFESPAVERRARNLSARSKSTPRGFAHDESFTPAAIPPPDYDQDCESIYSRRPSRQLHRRHPRSTSSTPKTQRAFRYNDGDDYYSRGSPVSQRIYNQNMESLSPAMTETPIYAPNGEYTFSRPASRQYLGDVRRSRSTTAMGDAQSQGYTSPALKRVPRDMPWTNDTLRNPYDSLRINNNYSNNSYMSPGEYEHEYEYDSILSPTRRDNDESRLELPKPTALSISVKSLATKGARPATAYLKEPWKLTIRREIFFPGEQLDDADAIDLVFAQVIGDCRKNNPYRIRQFERERINFILNKHRVPVESLDNPVDVAHPVKIEIINEARKWPLYFLRMYPVVEEWSDSQIPMVLGVGETGIRVMTQIADDSNDPLQAKAHFDYHDISDVIHEDSFIIKIVTKQNIISRFRCMHAKQAIDFINRFLDVSPKQKIFVTAISDYQIKDNNLLSFFRGDIVQIVKPNVQNQAPSAGNWLYGKIGNRFGWFPAEYVQPASTTATNTESEYGSEIYAPPSSVHATYAAPSHYRSHNAIIYGSPTKGPDNIWVEQPLHVAPQGERLTMTEFALRYFRQPKSSDYGSFTLKRKKKDWTWQDVTDKVKYTEKPLTHSLLKLESSEFDKTAVDLFDCVMRYMGDMHKKRGQTVTDCVYEILSVCHKNQVLADEVYCQIIKQTTCNKSPKADSLLLGWRLFTIFTAYFAPSTSLQPYLIKYLNDIANDPRRPFNGTANLCLINLQQTLKYGGRKFILTAAEVEAITSGKNVKRQAYEYPGDQKKLISTRTITVAEEVIRDMCNDMNVWSETEQAEFALCYILESDSSLRVLSNNEYILDITSELETRNEKFTLILTRTVWIHPLREDNQLYIDVLFFQVMPNYMAGLLTTLTTGVKAQLPAKILDDAATLAAYLFIASGNTAGSLTDKDVNTLVPKPVFDRAQLSASNWVTRIAQKLAAIPPQFDESIARLEFLKIIQNWPLYGSAFYFVSKCHVSSVPSFENPIVAVNKSGLNILSPENINVLWSCQLSEIRSSRKHNSTTGSFLDIHLGPENEPEAFLLTIDTDLGSEIARVIGQYVYLSNHKAQTIFNTRNVRQA